MHVTALHLYPVKSLRGFAVPAAEIDELGFAGDRRFLVIDETGKFQTQRQITRMALVSTALSNCTLTLSAEGAGPNAQRGTDRDVGQRQVRSDEVFTIAKRLHDEGDELVDASVLCAGGPVLLVRFRCAELHDQAAASCRI